MVLTFKVQVTGLNEFIAKNKRAMAALENGEFRDALAEKVKNRAKYFAPNKTGNLIKHIKITPIGTYGFKLTCDATNYKGQEYAGFLEFGTKYIMIGTPENPRSIQSPYRGGSQKTAYLPFMRWAIWRTMQDKKKIFKDSILKNYI